MSDDNLTDVEAYDKEYNSFIKQLEEFHTSRATPFKRIPRINGKSIDLYLLYVVVTAKGGWHKVNQRNEWEDILQDFRLPGGCVNAGTALKQIYIRYLDVYERVHYLGEDGDDRSNENDDDDSRSARAKRTILRSLNTVPLSYNHQQHSVPEAIRLGNGMSNELWKPSQYDNLSLSLTCPLPNEHDFSFNLCTLLSNEGRHVMQLSQCERLINLIVAHTGVFADRETQKYFISNYKAVKGKNLLQFWADAIENKSVLELLSSDYLNKSCKKPQNDVESSNTDGATTTSTTHVTNDEENVQPNIPNKEPSTNSTDQEIDNSLNNDNAEDKENADLECLKDTNKTFINTDLDEIANCDKVELNISQEDTKIFHLGRDIGQLDSEGTRITQVLHILRNLSFEENNVSSLAQSSACLRFLVLCIWSNWGGLTVGGLDTLGNIAPEVRLKLPSKDITSAMLLSSICNGISSPDRAQVLRSLEVLNKLAMSDPNEEILSYNIEQMVYDQICRYLAIHDIMLLIYTLESLYSLSSLGTPSCNSIVRAKGAIHTLVSLLTVEAQSYGPEACIGMKVVETVTGVVADPEASTAGTTTPAVTTTTPSIAATPPPATPIVTTTVASRVSSPVGQVPIEGKKIGGKIVSPELEEFVLDWVVKNYEGCNGNCIEQAIVYRHFAAAMHAHGRKQGLNPVLLSNCMRQIFGTTVGPSRKPIDDGVEKWHYNGIRKRDGTIVPSALDKKKKIQGSTPLPNSLLSSNHHQGGTIQIGSPITVINQRPVVVSKCEPASSPVAPILKAQLSAPLRPATPNRTTVQAPVGGTLPLIGGIGGTPRATTPVQPSFTPTVENSSLIKSLLANKVSRNIQKNQQGDEEYEKNSSSNGIHNNEMKKEEDSNSSFSVGLDDKLTSFEGILQNGVKNNSDEVNLSQKNVLADLLEKTVGGDILNGVVEKDLKINDKDFIVPNQIKINGPITTNGQINVASHGVKRSATPDSGPVKRFALEDPNLGQDGRITLYVSQNGNESGETLAHGGGHQIVLSQGQQPIGQNNIAVTNTTTISNQVILNQGIQTTASTQAVLNNQTHVQSNNNSQTVVTQQGQVILQRPGQSGVIVQGSGQIIQSTGQIIGTSSQNSSMLPSSGTVTQPAGGHVIQHVIQHGQAQPQRVILHQSQLSQMLGGQVILSQGTGQPVVVQNANNIQGQVIVQGNTQGQLVVGNSNQGGVVLPSNTAQTVMVSNTQGQVIVPANQSQVVSSTGQAMILTNNQGQPIIMSGQHGQQLVMSSGQQQTVVTSSNQSSHVVVPGSSMGGTMLLAPQTGGAASAKTLIILPNQKVMVPGTQANNGHQMVLPRPLGPQVVQVVSGNNTINSGAIRTVRSTSAVDTSVSVVNSSTMGAVATLSSSAIAPAPAGPAAIPVSHTITSTSQISQPISAPRAGAIRMKAMGLQYLCEWRGCNQIFSSPGQVYHHACKVHCPPHVAELQCQWAGCDSMTRKRFSTMTHIHDRHCNEQLLQILAVRRQQLSTLGKTEIPVPQAPPPHPGYAPNAAFHAIKRHALEVITQRDAVEKEGPVTKSIRLTAALILRNLVIYSNHGKTLLRSYESQLANVAISAMESSRTIAQILYDIHLSDSDQTV